MKVIFVINGSPWGSTLALTAHRMACAMLEAGHELPAVFFREDGVYNSIQGTASDSGTHELARSWAELGEQHGTDLMVCQSSAARRLSQSPDAPCREASLVELMDLVADCDRVMTF